MPPPVSPIPLPQAKKNPAPVVAAPTTEEEHTICEAVTKPKDPGQIVEFVALLKTQKNPALAALIGNSFHLSKQDDHFAIYLDRQHENLIPLIRSPRNKTKLAQALQSFFEVSLPVRYYIGEDPNFVKASQADAALKAKVKAHPIVKYLLDQFNGTIISCQVENRKKKEKKANV